MVPWTGIALALTEPGGDAMDSRLSTYVHPLAGRPLAWHTLAALASLRPAPERLVLVAREELNPEAFAEISPQPEVVYAAAPERGRALQPDSVGDAEQVLLIDAAAPALWGPLQHLIAGPADRVLADASGYVAAAWLSRERAEEVLGGENRLAELGAILPAYSGPAADGVFVVRDRCALSRASTLIRDRLVHRLMEGGVTFLLPETVLVDVDVRIGRDSVIYPGVVLEGQTTIGDETVVGPACRIIDSWIGSGVEMKGWNYVSRSSIRNRAILEPYVRRGFD